CYDLLRTKQNIEQKAITEGNFIPLSEEFENAITVLPLSPATSAHIRIRLAVIWNTRQRNRKVIHLHIVRAGVLGFARHRDPH
ncbi:MAG: hypothetical protein KHY68_12510, partial [Collinsella sp.]|nr:hypothetical protein [Collinsella sp.]